MAPADFEALRPYLRPVDLTLRTHLVVPDVPVASAWFVESGIVSVITTMADGRQVEAGIIGHEGMVDVATVNGVDRSPLDAFVQLSGKALRMSVAELQRAMAERPGIRAHLAKFAQALLVQIAHTSFANAANTIEERLARWILMASDRAPPGEAIAMTHEFLATMLGVRRAGVTIGVQALTDVGAISTSRGRIEIANRENLKSLSRGVYGPPELEYERLFARRGGGIRVDSDGGLA